MATKALFVEMFEYDTWANRRIAGALAAMPEPDAEALGQLSHHMAAKELWMLRLEGIGHSGYDPFPKRPLEAVQGAIEASAKHWSGYLASIDESRLDAPIDYVDTRGKDYRTTARDILLQVFGHGIHHRAQANLLIRRAGGQPVPIDYMVYARK